MKIKSLLLLLFLTFTAQLNLIPDNTNPLLVLSPSTATTTTFEIKFTFPSTKIQELGPDAIGSNGLNYNQYFGLKFPTSMATDLNFDATQPLFSCALSNGSYSFVMVASPSQPGTLSGISAEKNIAFCKLADVSTNVPLLVGDQYTYTLKITFGFKITTNFIQGLSVFTATSNNPDRIIIDSLPLLGSVALYNDWKNSTPIPLNINSGEVTVTNSPSSSTIFPYSTFDVSLVLHSTEFITANDYLIVINYPTTTVSAPKTVDSSQAVSNDVNQIALKGQLKLSQLSNGMLLLGGVSEDLIPNRTFKLNLRGWAALSTDLGILKSIQVLVYYKNTYSVFSYSDYPLITVQKTTLSLSANHPELWDIYRNAAWPVQFTISSTTDISNSNGVYVVIRQNNAAVSSADGGNLVTFVASTCDFSNTSSVLADYGSRPACFPLRLDHNYPGTASTFNGSGIFFFINGSIKSTDSYVLNVWMFADICGGEKFNNFSGTAFVVPTFEVSIHTNIITNKLNENRFDFTKEIAVGSGSFAGKCWNNKIQSFTVQALETKNDAGDNNFRSDLGDNLDDPSTDYSMTLRFKEITSWQIGSNTDGACTSCYEADISTTDSSLQLVEQFLYSASNQITNTSFFTAVAPLNLEINSKLSSGLPGSVINGNIPGTLTVQFSKMWFTGTDNFKYTSTNTCFLSWALQNPASTSPLNYSSLAKDISTSTDKNFMATKRLSTSVSDFDENASFLVMPNAAANSASNIMKLVSNTNSGQASEDWLYFPDEVPAFPDTKVAWFTNCIKWNPNQTIKSLYTYIDIQFIWTYTANSSSSIFSNVRLIKLFPEGGVFNDKPNGTNVSGYNVNPYVNHVVLAKDSDTFSPVCLIELNGNSILNIAPNDSTSNVFAIWLGFGVLLETDYSDASATYPAGPILPNAKAYGLQSQIPMNPGNLYVSTDYNGTTPENVPLYVILNQLQDPAVFGNSAAAPQKGENSSSYHFLMGSLVLFTGLSGNGVQSSAGSLYIPYYCPYAYPDTNTAERKYLNFVPSIFAAWLNMPNHSEVNQISSYLYYGTASGNDLVNKMSILLSRNSSASNTIKTGPFKGDSETLAANIANTKTILGTLRWNTYTDTTNTNVLKVFNGVRDTSQTNSIVTCTGFSLFFNMSINLDSTINFSTITNGKNGYYISSKVFYVMGKPFKNAAYWGGLTYSGDGSIGNMPVKSPVSTHPSLTITGIIRPDIRSFISSEGVLTVSNKVAFSCVPAHSSAYDALTNYFYEDDNSNFILDWAPSTSNWQVSIGYDNSDVFKNDIAGNALFTITSTASIPSSSMILFQSPTFNQNTICGIKTQNSVASDCTLSGTYTVNCPVLNTDKSFNICCYNIIINSSIDISSLSANFSTEPSNLSLQKYILQDVYDASSQIASSPFSYTIDNTSLTEMIGTKFSEIIGIAYKHNNQAGGFGSIQMTLKLARNLIRNMQIDIVGNFSPLLINGNSPRCFVSSSNSINLGKNWDDGDALINACNVSTDMQKITILTNNFIYKCGKSFTNTLYLTLSPVVVADWNDNTMNQNFQVNLSLGGSDVALNNHDLNLSLDTQVTSQPTVSGQWDNLCTVTSVVPRIPGEIAEYEFTIDLLTNKDALKNSKLNEVTIFWPYQYYGSVLDNVYCYSSKVLLNCYFSDEGIMNIIIPNLTVGNTIKVYVTGVQNPEIIGDYSFPCTVNNYDLTSLTRTNVITGSGLLKDGITATKININGNLRFLNIANPVTDTNPRETSIHKFRVAFDEATGLTSLPITFLNDIVLHIYFPNDYNFPWYSYLPTANVEAWSYDNDYIITPSSLSVNSVSVSGNRITLTIKAGSANFDTNFMYLDISLSNISNPNDSTTTTFPAKITTSPYLITMTNSDETVLFRTYTNINTYSTNLIGSSVLDTVNWSRGNSFFYDNTRWTMDIYTDSTQTNKILMRPGRYTVAYFNVGTSTTNNQSHAAGDLSLTDGIFQTPQKKTYMVSTAIMKPIPFLVGCTCLTAPGEYIINFKNSNDLDFTPLSPVIVIVDNSNFGQIQFSTSNSVPPAGSLWVPIWITDYNFDDIDINWEGDINNDATATLTSIKISSAVNIISENVQKMAVFATTNEILASSQTFIASTNNSCYKFASDTASFAITGTSPVDPLVMNLNNFAYANSKIDNTLDKNSVKFIFTPPNAPNFMYCALACGNSSFPADSDIINQTKQTSTLLQFSSNQILDTSELDLVFSNLARGLQYKLKCILKSTHANSSSTTSITLLTATSTTPNDDTIYPITPESAEVTNCAQFNFVTDPGHETRDAILNYCQNFFSNTGWYNNGCIICTTPDASKLIGGLQFPQSTTCSGSAQSTVISTTTNPIQSSSNSYVVCPVPTSTCSTNAGPTQTYTALFSQFTNNLYTNELLTAAVNNSNVKLDPSFPVVTILDNSNTLNILNLSVTFGSRNRYGQFIMSATYSTPALCYWQISSLSTAPSFTSIASCTDLSWCGRAEVGPVSFPIEVLNEREFAYDTTYYVYFGCSNDVTFTTSTSNVASFGNFLFKSKPILQVTPLAASSLNFSITTLFSLIVMILLI